MRKPAQVFEIGDYVYWESHGRAKNQRTTKCGCVVAIIQPGRNPYDKIKGKLRIFKPNHPTAWVPDHQKRYIVRCITTLYYPRPCTMRLSK